MIDTKRLLGLHAKLPDGIWIYMNNEGGAYDQELLHVPVGMDTGLRQIAKVQELEDYPDEMEYLAEAANQAPELAKRVDMLEDLIREAPIVESYICGCQPNWGMSCRPCQERKWIDKVRNLLHPTQLEPTK